MPVAPRRPTAAQLALSLPEIVTMIMDATWLSDYSNYTYRADILTYRDLKKLIRVNRLWFEIGVEKLWADRRSIDWLLRVPPTRRQIYASKMTQITVSGTSLEVYHREYNGLVFRRLRKTAFEVYGRYTLPLMEPYLGPSLQSVCFSYVPEIDSEVFVHLAREIPSLQEISISTTSFRATPKSFSDFIRHAPFLKKVIVSVFGGGDTTVKDELVSCLAHCRRLERLQIPWVWTESTSQQAAAAVLHSGVVPFPQIAELVLIVSSKAISRLVILVVNVTQLTLTVKDSTVDVLQHVSSLTNLRGLIVYYYQFSSIPAESMRALGALSKLSILHLGPFPYENTRISVLQSTFSDNDCETLASQLPHLHNLRLRMQCNISTKAVESFLRHCPNFRTCEIFQPLDTADLFTTAPGDMVFPQLTMLSLRRLTGEEIMRSVCILLPSQIT